MELQVCVSFVDGSTVVEDSMALHVSVGREASFRCMMSLTCVKELCMRAQIRDEGGEQLCDSGLVSLRDDDWVCLSSGATSANGTGLSSRLLSCTREYAGGWILVFDVKEQSDSTALLKFVRVARSAPIPDYNFEASMLDESGTESVVMDGMAGPSLHSDASDCTETDYTALHPKHSQLLRLIRQPGTKLLDASMWEEISRGSLSASGLPFVLGQLGLRDVLVKNAQAELSLAGFGRIRDLSWADVCVSLSALVETMDNLQQNGFPPIFIFMYDQAWLLLAHLFGVQARVLDSDVVEMSLIVYAWSLCPAPTGRAIGGNFGQPHRDKSHKHCHTADGRPSMLTTWLPLVPVTADNGCMYCVPASCDPLFDQADDPLHMRPDEDFVRPLGQALLCEAGDMLTWQSNTIHWGSACAENVTQPRKSIATVFMLPGAGKLGTSGLATITAEELKAGLSLDARLRLVMKALIQYRTWHPDFNGLSIPG